MSKKLCETRKVVFLEEEEEEKESLRIEEEELLKKVKRRSREGNRIMLVDLSCNNVQCSRLRL